MAETEFEEFDIGAKTQAPEFEEFDIAVTPTTEVEEFDITPIGEQVGRNVGLALSGEAIGLNLPVQAPAAKTVGILEQLTPKQLWGLFRSTGAETGLMTAGGFEAERAATLRGEATSPVGMEGRLAVMAGMTPEERKAYAKDRANLITAKRAEESSQEFFQAAEAAKEQYGVDPRLESGLITQSARGLTKGAGMMAIAAAGGIPGLALQGSAESYGAAKAAGKSDDEADKDATRTLIALAIFGGANKAAASGLTKYLGKDAGQLKQFMVQAFGQSVGNEITSRSISAYEAALDAEPGQRMDKAWEAYKKTEAASVAQNVGFGVTGGAHAVGKGNARARRDIRLTEVQAENIRRAQAEKARQDQLIAEQNAAAERLGEQRQAQGVVAGTPVAPEALAPEIQARAEGAQSTIVSGAPTPQFTIDEETGVIRSETGEIMVEDSVTGELKTVTEGSPQDISNKVLVPEKGELPSPPEGGSVTKPAVKEIPGIPEPVAVAEPKAPEFKQWFKESKVVDVGDNPLLVYHGTPERGIDVFQPGKGKRGFGGWNNIGTWFTADKVQAEQYGEHFNVEGKLQKGTVYPAYLSFKNPWELEGRSGWDELIRVANHRVGKRTNDWTPDDVEKFREYLRVSGKDGIIIRGLEGDSMKGANPKQDYYLALYPEQIRVQKPKGEPSATEIQQVQEGVQTQPEGGTPRGQTQGAGAGDSLQRGAEGGGEGVVAAQAPAKAQPEVRTPQEFTPALVIGEVIIPAKPGEGHAAIVDRYKRELNPNDLRYQEKRDAANEAFLNDADHVFIDRDGQPHSRQEASDALGQKEPMQSETLYRLQEEAKTVPQASPESTVPEAPSGVTPEAPGAEAPPPPSVPEPPSSLPPEGRQPLPEPVGIKRADIEANQVTQDLPVAADVIRRRRPEVFAAAEEAIKLNSDLGSALIAEINKSPRPITDIEKAVMAIENTARANEYNKALDQINSSTTANERQTAEVALERARDRNQEAYEALRTVGTAAGRSLELQKLMVNKDYTLAHMESELKAVLGGEKALDPVQKKKAEDQAVKSHKKIKETEARVEKTENEQVQTQALEEHNKTVKEVTERAKKEIKDFKKRKSILDTVISAGDEAQERIRKRNEPTELSIRFLPFKIADLPDHILIGAGWIAKGIRGIKNFTKKLVETFGPESADSAESIYEASKKHLNEATRGERTVEKALERDEAGDLDRTVVYEVARAHVNAGVGGAGREGFDKVMKATAESLKAKHPDITESEVIRVYSGYGKRVIPSQAADRVILREYNALGQKISALEDILAKKFPEKSGPQRDKPTEDVRKEIREVKKALEKLEQEFRDNGIDIPGSAEKLATATQTVITRLTNQKESLQRQIAAKQRDEVKRGGTVDTPEIRNLKKQVDALNDILDKVSPRKGESDADKLKRMEDAAEARREQLNQQLRTGQIDTQGRIVSGITSGKLQRINAEIAAMRDLKRELQRARAAGVDPNVRKINAGIKAVEKQISELDRQLKTGDIAAKTGKPGPTSDKLDALRLQRDAMVELRNDLRNALKPKADPEAAQIKAVKKSLELIEDEILTGVRAAKATGKPPGPELAELRSERDQMRRHLIEIRKSKLTKKSPEEIQLQRYKAGLATRTKAIRDRIAKGDYEKRTRKETMLDAEAEKARFEYQKAKDEYEQKVFEFDLSRRGFARRALDATMETINLSRSIMTSFDLSAPLRQGSFITLAHPIRSLKAFPTMFGSAMNEAKFAKFQNQLLDPSVPGGRKNAAMYRESGLDLSEVGDAVTKRKLEENYQSRWAKNVWGVAGSQRAYTAFLNRLRADSFDTMVETLGKSGKVTPKEAKDIANYINVATGRGKYSIKAVEQATQALNLAFFAPKYVISRFQLLFGQPFYSGNARTRKAIAAEYARYIRGVGVVYGLAALAGATIEDDMDSPDFGKPKFGNTRLDPFGGLIGATTFSGRFGMAYGTTLTSAVGMTSSKKAKERRQKLPDAINRYYRQKLAPVPATFIYDIPSGKDVVGKRVSTTGALIDLAFPMSLGDISEALRRQGVEKGPALSLLSIFGASLNTYGPGDKKRAPSPYGSPGEIYEDWLGKRRPR